MAIRLFFEYNNQLVQLPVNPEELTISYPGTNETVEVVKLGEVNILRDVGLAECELEGFFPANANPPYVLTKGKFMTPQQYVTFFTNLRKNRLPCRFLVSDTKINMMVSIESFETSLVAGDDDVHYTLELKEYKPYSAKTVTIKKVVNTTATATQTATVRPKKAFAVGDLVTVNGNYWYSSYGSKPSYKFNNFQGKISHKVADTKRKYRYHIVTPSGGYQGWVSEDQMKHR